MMKYFGLMFAQFLAAMVTGGYTPINVKMSKRDLGIPKVVLSQGSIFVHLFFGMSHDI